MPGTLGDTTLELHNADRAIIASNDDWQDAINAQSIPPRLQPPNHLESALLVSLNPGAYTAILRGFHNMTGIALVEVYDTSVGSTQLTNISTRGFVQTGDNVMIAGVIAQFHNKQVVVRALGPTLGQPPFNVPGALSDPILELHDGQGTVLASNDDWQQASNAQSIPSNLRPPNTLESAILGTLTPGNYTAIVRGFNGATGNALVEVYALN